MNQSGISQSIHCIINPASGKQEPVLDILNSVLRPKGIRWDVSVTQNDGDAKSFAKKAVADPQYDAVAVYGGDGTISDAAVGCIGSDTPMMILPGGTSNLMASDLGIGTQTQHAVDILTNPGVAQKSLDTGIVNGDPFIYVISAGISAEVVLDTPRTVKNTTGPLGYYLSGLQKMSAPQEYTFTFTIDQQQHTERGVAMLVMNSAQISLGLKVVDHASMDDGLFDVVLIRKGDIGAILEFLSRKVNSALPSRSISTWQAKKITIETDPEARLSVDDQARPMKPLDISLNPSSLPVLVPMR